MRWKRISGKHLRKLEALEILNYIGPGFLVTVGFIDPGNWASNVAAGSQYGYYLLWIVTLSTIMLIVLQHNAAHLGIVTGLCLSEASTKFFRKGASRLFLLTAILASVSTALAEVLGAAIGLNMLFGIPLTDEVLRGLFFVTFALHLLFVLLTIGTDVISFFHFLHAIRRNQMQELLRDREILRTFFCNC